jgi:hypothetical protein
MAGDGRSALVGTWDGDGVYYRDFAKSTWFKMATSGSQVVAGDLAAMARMILSGSGRIKAGSG